MNNQVVTFPTPWQASQDLSPLTQIDLSPPISSPSDPYASNNVTKLCPHYDDKDMDPGSPKAAKYALCSLPFGKT